MRSCAKPISLCPVQFWQILCCTSLPSVGTQALPGSILTSAHWVPGGLSQAMQLGLWLDISIELLFIS